MTAGRLAPSPTGAQHLGNARTYLLAYLSARRSGARLIMRIEDIDSPRVKPWASQQAIDDLRWLGINWDEGPQIDGPSGPYFQSQRIEIYNRYIKKLLDSGDAYYCFDTPEELEVMRQKAIETKSNFNYQRPEKFPDEKDVETD